MKCTEIGRVVRLIKPLNVFVEHDKYRLAMKIIDVEMNYYQAFLCYVLNYHIRGNKKDAEFLSNSCSINVV